jgi:hypothetical protein
MRTAVQWNDSRIVKVFLADHDVRLRLNDLDETPVRAAEQRRAAVSETALRRIECRGARGLAPDL